MKEQFLEKVVSFAEDHEQERECTELHNIEDDINQTIGDMKSAISNDAYFDVMHMDTTMEGSEEDKQIVLDSIARAAGQIYRLYKWVEDNWEVKSN